MPLTPATFRLLELIDTTPSRQVKYSDIAARGLTDPLHIALYDGLVERDPPPDIPRVLPRNLSTDGWQQLTALAAAYNQAAANPTFLLTPKGRAEMARYREAQAAGDGRGTGGSEDLPREGAKLDEDDVPAAFREGGQPGGAVLTASYLAGTPEWDLLGPYLSRNYGPGKALTTHIRVGRAKAYLFKDVAALRVIKTMNQARREEGA